MFIFFFNVKGEEDLTVFILFFIGKGVDHMVFILFLMGSGKTFWCSFNFLMRRGW